MLKKKKKKKPTQQKQQKINSRREIRKTDESSNVHQNTFFTKKRRGISEIHKLTPCELRIFFDRVPFLLKFYAS